MLIVGLTGGMATGKNCVASILEELDAEILDADDVCRKLMEPGEPAFDRIVSEFGGAILNPEGGIDRKELGSIVFGDKEKRERLNAILHPEIIREEWRKVAEIKGKRPGSTVVINAPLLIESGNYKDVDTVLLVVADEELMVNRAMTRDNLSRGDALARIRAQMPVEEKAKYADHVIENNGSLEELREKVGTFYRALKG